VGGGGALVPFGGGVPTADFPSPLADELGCAALSPVALGGTSDGGGGAFIPVGGLLPNEPPGLLLPPPDSLGAGIRPLPSGDCGGPLALNEFVRFGFDDRGGGGGGGGGGLPFRVAAEAAASWGQLMKIKVDFGQG